MYPRWALNTLCSLECPILLSPHPECWVYRFVPPLMVYTVLGTKPRTLCLSVKHSNELQPQPHILSSVAPSILWAVKGNFRGLGEITQASDWLLTAKHRVYILML